MYVYVPHIYKMLVWVRKLTAVKIMWNVLKFLIEKDFTALEKLLSGSSGKYCIGNELTSADFFVDPQIMQAILFKVDVSPYANIARINENLKELRCFTKADAFEHPDCPHHVNIPNILYAKKPTKTYYVRFFSRLQMINVTIYLNYAESVS